MSIVCSCLKKIEQDIIQDYTVEEVEPIIQVPNWGITVMEAMPYSKKLNRHLKHSGDRCVHHKWSHCPLCGKKFE
ncbi:hypothetical protein SAMN02745215_05050 [Desulfitobacterium chlororespirans DSM 11544]|uniref:Uncharacterized protein n=1 Tax=Desulfitobacterium chlororespirans DSM 11544 TaxID=1121395 RepID=A0A1M7UYF9_9FIRM|nr:hypothetical protein SAMN02745215_05050 [Desulfitobacterium chlororespirans DSM 11544]